MGSRMSSFGNRRPMWSPSSTAKQPHVFAPGRIEAGRAAAFDHFEFDQLRQLLVSRRRIVDHSQGIQVPAVAGHGLFSIVNQRGHPLGHGKVARG
jgi:hypothetical protein